MSIVKRNGAIVALCAMRLAIPGGVTARDQGEAIELRVMTYASDPSNVQRAGHMALDVLGGAGLHALWRVCDSSPGRRTPARA